MLRATTAAPSAACNSQNCNPKASIEGLALAIETGVSA